MIINQDKGVNGVTYKIGFSNAPTTGADYCSYFSGGVETFFHTHQLNDGQYHDEELHVQTLDAWIGPEQTFVFYICWDGNVLGVKHYSRGDNDSNVDPGYDQLYFPPPPAPGDDETMNICNGY